MILYIRFFLNKIHTNSMLTFHFYKKKRNIFEKIKNITLFAKNKYGMWLNYFALILIFIFFSISTMVSLNFSSVSIKSCTALLECMTVE